ncbi:MAG: siroheme synthase [Pseudolabrys sp.]
MNAPLNPPDQPSRRIQRLARLPVFFALFGKRALVAGGSAAAAWKAELLSAAGAAVEVYSCEPCEELRALAANPPAGAITIHLRDWVADDFAGAAIAVGACDNDDAAASFALAARNAGVPVNVIDKPAFCDFSFGAIVNRSPLVISISTDGAAPVFAQAVRARLEALLPQGFARWTAAASRWRAEVGASGLSFAARRKFWHLFTARALDAPEHVPGERDFTELMHTAGTLGPTAERGSVSTFNVDADNPGRLTLDTLRALQSADVLVYDEMICDAVLDFARREARRIAVAPWQPDIDDLCSREAAAGRRVVRLLSAAPAAPRAREDRKSPAAETLS